MRNLNYTSAAYSQKHIRIHDVYFKAMHNFIHFQMIQNGYKSTHFVNMRFSECPKRVISPETESHKNID